MLRGCDTLPCGFSRASQERVLTLPLLSILQPWSSELLLKSAIALRYLAM